MKRLIPIGCGLAALGLAGAAPSPASAQAWIGQIAGDAAGRRPPSLCRRQVTPPAEAVAEAGMAARALMRLYWERAAASDPADVSAAFYLRDAMWIAGETRLEAGAVAAISDPLARRAGAVLPAEPATFILATDRQSARGLWPVEVGDGAAPVGYYLVDFYRIDLGRGAHEWKLGVIELVAEQPAYGLGQYCRLPDDFESLQAARAQDDRERAARRAERETERARR